jgi:CrcB protein
VSRIAAIAIGGALGAVLRYGLSGVGYRLLGIGFPWGTLVVNLSGCFLIGVLWGLHERAPLSPAFASLVFVGVLGGFTTFSTFGLETAHLFRDGEVRLGLLNVLASNVLGLGLVVAGLAIARLIVGLLTHTRP